MKLKMKRTLSCLLTVLLLLTMLPVSALAEGDLKTELGITNEDITVTEITKDNEAILSQAASDRYWGVYAEGMFFDHYTIIAPFKNKEESRLYTCLSSAVSSSCFKNFLMCYGLRLNCLTSLFQYSIVKRKFPEVTAYTYFLSSSFF